MATFRIIPCCDTLRYEIEITDSETGTFPIIAVCHEKAHAEKVTACLNACEGYDPARIPDMLQTARELLVWAAADGHIDELAKLAWAAMKAFGIEVNTNPKPVCPKCSGTGKCQVPFEPEPLPCTCRATNTTKPNGR